MKEGPRRILKDHLYDLLPETDRQLELISSIRLYKNGFFRDKFLLHKKPQRRVNYDKMDELWRVK